MLRLLAVALALPALAAGGSPYGRAARANERGLAAGGDYARLVRASGPVTIKGVGHSTFVKASAGASLIPGDWLQTGPSGVAQLELDGGGVLLLTGGSLLALGAEAEDTLEVKLGEWLLGVLKRLEGGRRIRVKTPQAVAAVRGTLFWGKTDPKETLLAGLEREVEVTAKGKTVVLKPGHLVRVPSGAAPADPVAHEVPAPFLDRFKVDGGLGGVEALLGKKPEKSKKPKE